MKRRGMRNMTWIVGIRGIAVASVAMGALLSLGATSAAASSSVTICVPTTAGSPVTSAGSSGECTSGTSVALPSEAAEQSKLLSILPHLNYEASGIGGKPTIQFSGVNVQVLANGGEAEGNLIVGADERPGEQTGYDNLVVGSEQTYTSHNSILGGAANTSAGAFTDVFGTKNKASNLFASVTAGYDNLARNTYSSVSGGAFNNAESVDSSVAGGSHNHAEGLYSTISGGSENKAVGGGSSISGGQDNVTSSETEYGSISGGYENTIEPGGKWSWIGGGFENVTHGKYSSVSGGSKNKAGGEHSSVSGGLENKAEALYSSIFGFHGITCSTEFCAEP
jgi:hypothetical protein